jgi:hypothetical protein
MPTCELLRSLKAAGRHARLTASREAFASMAPLFAGICDVLRNLEPSSALVNHAKENPDDADILYFLARALSSETIERSSESARKRKKRLKKATELLERAVQVPLEDLSSRVHQHWGALLYPWECRGWSEARLRDCARSLDGLRKSSARQRGDKEL